MMYSMYLFLAQISLYSDSLPLGPPHPQWLIDLNSFKVVRLRYNT